MGTTEDMTRYTHGGYHPCIVGNILHGQSSSYRIVHKLGFGSYATVWLAEMMDASKAFVAVKVSTADGLSAREAESLRAVQSEHTVTLLDAFALDGPNGTHSVIVTDVLVPVLSLLSSHLSPRWRKKIAYDLVLAVHELHESGVVHGDLHLGNVGITIPQLLKEDPEDVMQDLDSHELTIVLPVDPKNSTPSLPAYVVAPCNLARYYGRICGSNDTPHAKIFDFGSAHFAGSQPTSFQCAVEACAPETVLARIVDKDENPPIGPTADVWALGAMIYEIVSGSAIFRSLGISALLTHMASMTGSVPSQWQARWPNSDSPRDAGAWWGQRRDHLKKGCTDDKDTDDLINLLRKTLVLDPSKRPSPKEISRDPWFMGIQQDD
ncbi:hypothetical protein V5O48_016981 [Marasmius crinis-equi]|uniref:Protein kinase domain-containing protein n=1 Tax=Marasmius crinis-equi TaxID=585013 RepID=A0ABR3EQB8_9AGAR